MERFTISLDDDLARQFDQLIARRGYSNRSEAVRDLLRGQLEQEHQARDDSGYCVASLSYVYNHHERELAERLTEIQHRSHDLTVSTLHAHLDHENCLETVLLKGPAKAVRAFAEAMMAERGVRHGQINLISVDMDQGRHSHAYHVRGKGEPHVHLKPKS
ncbi:MAG: nickel-responsive transcriptional regulator NikR [Rhodocyclaceae bacterium]|nr:MAG: nickel-responsive transcriptional regulator NikR [Rhodocyclaceae bacterium]